MRPRVILSRSRTVYQLKSAVGKRISNRRAPGPGPLHHQSYGRSQNPYIASCVGEEGLVSWVAVLSADSGVTSLTIPYESRSDTQDTVSRTPLPTPTPPPHLHRTLSTLSEVKCVPPVPPETTLSS